MSRFLIFVLLIGHVCSTDPAHSPVGASDPLPVGSPSKDPVTSEKPLSSSTKGNSENPINAQTTPLTQPILTGSNDEPSTTDLVPDPPDSVTVGTVLVTESTTVETITEPVKEMSMERCFQPKKHGFERFCFVGNGCFKKVKTTQHDRFVRFREMLGDPRKNRRFDGETRDRIMNCKVVAIVESKEIDEKIVDSVLKIEYQTNSDHEKMPIIFGMAEIKVKDHKLTCHGECGQLHAKSHKNEDGLLFTGEFDWKRKANLTRCSEEPDLICFIGNQCMHGITDPHGSILSLAYTNAKLWTAGSASRKLIEGCDLGVTIKHISNSIYSIEYHSKTAYNELVFHVDKLDNNMNAVYTFSIKEGTLQCSKCRINFAKTGHVADHLYFRATLVFGERNKGANLTRCFDENFEACFVGNKCTSDDVPDHTAIEHITSDQRKQLMGKDEWRVTLIECNLGATLTKMTKDGQVVPEYYDFDFHCPPQYWGFNISFGKRNITVKDGFVHCQPDCQFKGREMTEKEKAIPNFWAGTIYIGKLLSPIAMKGKGKDEEEIEEKWDHGTIVIACCCGLVGIIGICVVVGFVIRRRLNARNEQRRLAIQQVAAKAAKADAMSCNLSEKRKKRTQTEAVPLIDQTQSSESSDDPESEKTTSSRFGSNYVDDNVTNENVSKETSHKDKTNKTQSSVKETHK